MNVVERKMIEILSRLSGDYGVFEIKAEFEAEASRMEELMRLKDVISAANLPLIIKIGGVEAITDVYMGLSLGVKGIVAPMAETPYAVGKFLNVIENYVPKDNAEDIEFAINIETKSAVENFDQILELEKINLLTSFTVGRVDLVGSYGLGRDSIENDFISEKVRGVFEKSKSKGFKTALGGGISAKAIKNIELFAKEKLIDKFETRKVVFDASLSISNLEQAILNAVSFEYCWLISKRRYYGNARSEDEKRILMIEDRMKDQGFEIPSF